MKTLDKFTKIVYNIIKIKVRQQQNCFTKKVVTATIKRTLNRERVGGYAAGGSQCIDKYYYIFLED